MSTGSRRATALPSPVADVRRSETESGARVLTDRVPTASSVTLTAWVGVGGRDEPAELWGASHFLEHLVFKGTDRRSALQVALDIDGVGGEMNAVTSSEYTAFYARVPAEEYRVAVDTLLDVVGDPALRDGDVDAERAVIHEELAAAEDDPEDLVAQRLFESLFPDHPLGREVLGSDASIRAIAASSVRAFHREWYTPRNLVVTASGAVDHERLAADVDEVLAHRSDPGARCPQRSEPPPACATTVVEHHPGEVVQLALGWRTVGASSDERYALALVDQLLGTGPASRLFQTIREQRGLTYSISSALSLYVDAGAFTVGCAASTRGAEELLEAVLVELDRFAQHGVTAEDLARAKRALRGTVLLGLEDAGSRSARLGVSEMLRGRVVPLDEQLDRLDAVSLDELNEAARRLLRSPMVLAVVGEGDLDRLASMAP